MGNIMLRRLKLNASVVFRGHILNPLWLSRIDRRRIRSKATADAIMAYLEDYRQFAESLHKTLGKDYGPDCGDVIFSIWLQGEDNAPELVKACWRSVRANCSEKFRILDEKSLSDYIHLPEYIMEKWNSGKIKPAHFTDICRVELLSRYGGLWLDATDFVSAGFPEWLWNEDFFVYLSEGKQKGSHSFIQNCFIRARASSFLIGAWRDMIFEYWRREDSAADYFIHQLLFRFLVENNVEAASEFAHMKKICQDDTHLLWFENACRPYDEAAFSDICGRALFQKTEYKSKTANLPPRGTMAQALINSYR